MRFYIKLFLTISFIWLIFYGCTSPTSNTKRSNVWKDRLTNREYIFPDTIAGQSVLTYLSRPDINPIAKAFFEGRYRPTDNDSTMLLFSDITTTDSTLRPFYRWCLNFTISISDGALGEYLGKPAFDYVKSYPEEFFLFIDQDTSGLYYKNWLEMIAYSGLNNYNENFPKSKITREIENSCLNCDQAIKQRIHLFIKEIEDLINGYLD